MKLYCLFIDTEGLEVADDYDPELLASADEHMVENNENYWEEFREKALAKAGKRVINHRTVVIKVDDAELRSTFKTPQLQGEVKTV